MFLIQVNERLYEIKENIWIITDGIDTTLSKFLGETLLGHMHTHMEIIGISPWRLIEGKENLIFHNEKKLATYFVNKCQIMSERENKRFYLGQYHTHLFLIDTHPSMKKEDEIFAEVINFRTTFEKFIINKVIDHKNKFEKERKDHTKGNMLRYSKNMARIIVSNEDKKEKV